MAAPSRSASFTRALSKATFKATTVSLIGTFLLTGCAASSPGASPSGTVSGSTSPSAPTPTPSPTPTATYKPADAKGPAQNVPLPVKPALADEKSKQGLEAFAKYWYAVFSYAYETGDLKAFDSVTDPTCETCAKARQVIAGWHSEGRWIVGGQLDVDVAQTKFIETEAHAYQVITQLEQREISFYNANKTLHESIPKSELLGDIMIAKYVDGRWRALTVERL